MNRSRVSFICALLLWCLHGPTADGGEAASATAGIAPRGERRVLFVSDPSSIANNLFADPAEPGELRRWVNMLADSGVDAFNQEIYNQCWTTYWRSDRFEYDPRPQHQRFVPMLDAGTQPVEVLIDQAHQRGMTFIGGFRMNDNHGGVGQFVTAHPEWVLTEFPEGELYKVSKPLDFTFDGPRDYIHAVIDEAVRRFDLDGVELCFRDHAYFPVNQGARRAGLMTDLVRRVRATLDERGQAKGKKLLLGARVFSTLEECRHLGLDVPAWVGEGLIDYLSPQDVMYADFNAPYAEFGKLTRASSCMLYPALLPWTSVRARGRLDQIPLSPANCRALARTFYASGADGISVYNHFVTMWHAPFYPQSLRVLRSLGDPERIAAGERHYVFDPTYGGVNYFGPDRASTGAVKANRITLDRTAGTAQGTYGFRLYEDLERCRACTLLFRGFNLSLDDELEVQLNGQVVPADSIGRTAPRGTPADQWVREIAGERRRILPEQGRIEFRPGGEPPFSTVWFELTGLPLAAGENSLTVVLTRSDPKASGPIVIDEVEVWVEP